jgi:prephenate dehydrogenase
VDTSPFDRVGIVGLGLIGGSVALAARRRWPSIRITACDPAPVAREAVRQGLIDAIVESPSALSDSELIVLATPVQMVPGIIAQLADAGVTALVTDTGSTKRTVMSAYARVTSGELRRDLAEAASGREGGAASGILFVGGHPVAGSEAAGLAGARADLFDARPWLFVSGASGAAGDSREIETKEAMLASFVVGLGAKPEWTDAVTHDRVMAHVTQAPHVVATAVKPGGGGHDDESWQGVLDTNADFIADALVAIAAKLPTSSSALTETPAVRDLFERAKALKSQQ